jgi:hypothetical protein
MSLIDLLTSPAGALLNILFIQQSPFGGRRELCLGLEKG